MNEHETLDKLLLQMLSTPSQPQLSTHFSQRLAERLARGRLSVTDRFVIGGYALLAVLASIWWMRSESIPWLMIAGSLALPLVLAAAVRRWLW